MRLWRRLRCRWQRVGDRQKSTLMNVFMGVQAMNLELRAKLSQAHQEQMARDRYRRALTATLTHAHTQPRTPNPVCHMPRCSPGTATLAVSLTVL